MNRQTGSRNSDKSTDSINWSRHFASDVRHQNATHPTNEMSSTDFKVINTSHAQPTVHVVSTASMGSQTDSWDDPDAFLSQVPENLYGTVPTRQESAHFSARVWSWRVNRFDSRIDSRIKKHVDDEAESFKGSDKHIKFTDDQEHQDKAEIRKEKKRRESMGRNLRSKLGQCDLFRHDLKVWWGRFTRSHWEFPFFNDAINITESHFGSSVVSLFILTKWIFCLNFMLAMFWFLFVILPNMIEFPYKDIGHKFRATNLLDGKGLLGESFFFYGHYPSTLNGYHLDFAYLLAILLTYFGSFFVILRGIAKATSMSRRGEDNIRYKFATLLLATYDHNLTSREAINQATLGLINTFRDEMVEVKAHAAVFLLSRTEKTKVFLLRALAWIITIILIGGGCTGIFYLVVYLNFADTNHLGQVSNSTGLNLPTGFLQNYGTTIIFSLINMIVPMAIIRLPAFERYSSGKSELAVTLLRVFFLRMANLIALMFSLYSTVQHLIDDTEDQTNINAGIGCVGTVIGQEVYKLVIMDTLVHAIANLTLYFLLYFWTRTKRELHLPSAILVIIYRQALIWAGTLACPVMPFIGLLSMSVFFGVNYVIVHKTCKPPEKRWTQARHSAFFLRFLLFSLLILLPPVSYIIGSSDLLKLGKAPLNVPNGPFGLSQPTEAFSRWRNSMPGLLQEAFAWIMSDVVLLPTFLLLLTIVLYLRLRVAYTYLQTVYLKADLAQEREDNKNMAKRLRFVQQMELINKVRVSPTRMHTPKEKE